MADLMQAMEITAQLRKMRDLARDLTGEKYAEKIAPYREAIQRWHKESGEPVGRVCLHLCQQCAKHDSEYGQLLAFAACVEEMESPTTTPTPEAQECV